METPIIEDRFYTARDMARRYGVSPLTIWRWHRDKKIPQPRLISSKKCWSPAEVATADAQLLAAGGTPLDNLPTVEARHGLR